MTDKVKWRDAKVLRDRIAELEAERDAAFRAGQEDIRADLAKPQWQPAETPPKDETVVLVWHVTKLNPYAGFDTNIKKARYLHDLGEWQVESVGGNVPPVVTHWMHFPDAPEASE